MDAFDKAIAGRRTIAEKLALRDRASSLRELRDAWFVTQMDLARFTGLSLFSIHRLESKGIIQVNPRLDTIRRIARGLDMTPGALVDQLLGDQKTEMPQRLGTKAERA